MQEKRIVVRDQMTKQGHSFHVGSVTPGGVVYLQRRGGAGCLQFSRANSDAGVGFHLEVNPNSARITRSQNGIVVFNGTVNVRDCILEAAQEILNLCKITHNGQPMVVGDFVEAYCHGGSQPEDKFITPVVYCAYSDTVRHFQSNICLVAFKEGKFADPVLDVDRTAQQWGHAISKALSGGFHSCDIRRGDQYCKERLAWLIGCYVRESTTEEIICAIADHHLQVVKS